MSWSAKIRRTPLRLATGAFIFDSGIDHLKVDEETQGQLHEMAVGAYPFLRKVDPRLFAKALAVGELAVGGLLLAPIVPPGLRRERSVFPTQRGLGYAKDTWLCAIGISLFADSALEK